MRISHLTAREPFHPPWETIPPASAIRSVIHVFCSSADLLRSSKRKIGSCSSSSGDACCEKSGPVAGNSRRIPIRSGSATPRLENGTDRKSTRLNSSHLGISYAVFCLKKKNKRQGVRRRQVG